MNLSDGLRTTMQLCTKNLHALIGDNITWEGTRKRCKECKKETRDRRTLQKKEFSARNYRADRVTAHANIRRRKMLIAETHQVQMTLFPSRRNGDPALILKGQEFAIDIDGLHAIKEFREKLNELLSVLDKKTETV